MKKVLFAVILWVIIITVNSFSATVRIIIKGDYNGIQHMGEQREVANCIGNYNVCIDYRDFGIVGAEDNGYIWVVDPIDPSLGFGYTRVKYVAHQESSSEDDGFLIYDKTQHTLQVNTFEEWLNSLPE
ncbi:MAG: hypothetical protein ABIK31_06905 [candidate division WOR-3 bacterium]